jgi:prolyl-tRNA synthetase
MAGVYSWLPLGLRVLDKIESIVRQEMVSLGSQEVLMPVIQSGSAWSQTGRLTQWSDALYTLEQGGANKVVLGPSHEEIVTPLVGRFLQSYRDLPVSVFQIQTKFRNEARSRSGLLRGREFRMKDMYSFHRSSEDLDAYYDLALEAYRRIFDKCGIGKDTLVTQAGGGTFSPLSHEFQLINQSGEDTIYVSSDRSLAVNSEIYESMEKAGSFKGKEMKAERGIEVGNIFKLGSKFTDAFDIQFADEQGQRQKVWMGCYGIGTSRMVGAIVEAHHDERGIRWPKSVAPFDVHLLTLGKGAKLLERAEALARDCAAHGVSVLLDDRETSAGQKLSESDLIGIPVRLAISERGEQDGTVGLKLRTEEAETRVSVGSVMERITSSRKGLSDWH